MLNTFDAHVYSCICICTQELFTVYQVYVHTKRHM